MSRIDWNTWSITQTPSPYKTGSLALTEVGVRDILLFASSRGRHALFQFGRSLWYRVVIVESSMSRQKQTRGRVYKIQRYRMKIKSYTSSYAEVLKSSHARVCTASSISLTNSDSQSSSKMSSDSQPSSEHISPTLYSSVAREAFPSTATSRKSKEAHRKDVRKLKRQKNEEEDLLFREFINLAEQGRGCQGGWERRYHITNQHCWTRCSTIIIIT